MLAIACILLFLRPLPLVGSLYATAWIILIAYLMRFLTLAMKPVASAVAQISAELDEAAVVSGASPLWRIVTISAPLAAPAAAAGALLVFMSAFNELTVSVLLWSSRNETLGVVLFNLEEAGLGTQAAAIAASTVIVVMAFLAVLDSSRSACRQACCPGANNQTGITQASETAILTSLPIGGASTQSRTTSCCTPESASRTSNTGPR